MVDINCGECGRHKNRDKGCVPDKCLPGYKLFVDPMIDPKKYCHCGKKLTRPWTKPTKDRHYTEIALKCPEHGVIGYIEEQLRLCGV